MKKIFLLFLGVALLAGCEPQPFPSESDFDREAPAVPRGVTSTTGDRQVVISWYPNGERDLAGYQVYRGNAERGDYYLLGTTRNTSIVDRDVSNGRTYYYAVAAYDASGNESDLSYDLVFDTPRPAGYGVRLFDFGYLPSSSGYSFAGYRVQDYQIAEGNPELRARSVTPEKLALLNRFGILQN